MEDPVLTAFSPTRLNALTMQGLKWHSIWASKHPNQLFAPPAPPDPRLHWSGFEYSGEIASIMDARDQDWHRRVKSRSCLDSPGASGKHCAGNIH
jgi:hypothetical protein